MAGKVKQRENDFALSYPISGQYRRPIFAAVALQAVFGGLSLLILDGGDSARICGVALLAFWSGVFVLICRHPRHPGRLNWS
ncbi:MAG TPA: hypothetical protein PKN95_12565 [Verrucomicrobiota bacterium]|nr:hypothetical protein [Verrucomicrobiota bacterium]HNT15851.1 hypothetical protein [Verrucomicrobiota bacterium]